MLDLMYITNKCEIAKIAENAGVDRIFVDLEVLGKQERQAHVDSVKSIHSINDVSNIKKILTTAKLLVRINPINLNSEEEINNVILAGADIIMLPYYKNLNEVKLFLYYINKRVNTILLCETPEAVDIIDDVLELDGINEMYIGLNDLHLGYKKKFMFELLIDGTVENLANKFKSKNKKFGFGGIARLGSGDIPADFIIPEHYKLGSSIVILARAFCDVNKVKNFNEIEHIFYNEIKKIRLYENKIENYIEKDFVDNYNKLKLALSQIIN